MGVAATCVLRWKSRGGEEFPWDRVSPDEGPSSFGILRCLGQGGMGQVYLAEQLSLGRKVAFKVLRPDLARDNPAAVQLGA
jgi:serine/threonine protein kinase